MSSNLLWEPVVDRGKTLSDKLKYALRQREYSNARFESHDIPYLQGLLDAGVLDAQILIDGIEKHGAVKVWEDYG
jgi:hypothetical protein